VTPQADLVASLDGPANVQSATDFNYIISITNLGPSDAIGVVVTNTLPAGSTFVSASDGGTNDNGTVTWFLGTLTNGQSFSLTLTVTAPPSGSLTNIAGVYSLTGDPDPTNNVTSLLVTDVSDFADLGIGKSGPAVTSYGSNFDYTISVTNFGPATATGIVVTDSLPANLVFVSANPPAMVNGANQVIWTNLGSLASGATTNLTLTVSPSYSGAVENTASIGSDAPDPDTTNNTTPPVATTVNQGLPVITWPTPASIVYGTPLDTNQLNATASVPGTYLYSPTIGTVLPAGTNLLSLLFTPVDTNYLATNVTVSLFVLPATLTVTADNTNRVYGAANPAFTASYSGFVNGDTSSVLNGSPGLTTAATPGSPATTYPIVAAIGTLSAANYTFNFVNGTLTVGQATLTVTADNTNRVYGAANPAFTASYSGFMNGDTSSVLSGSPSLTTVATSGSPATNYPITAAIGTLSAANYTFSFANGTLTVGKAALTVTANDQTKSFGTALTLGAGQSAFTSSGLQNAETIGSVTLASAGAPAAASVGTYPLTPSNATGGTFNPANYNITYSNGILNVVSGSYGFGWTNPASITYGTPLGTNQNNATASVPGVFVYSPTNGTVLPAGTNTLSVLFTPTDTNYASTNLSVQLVVTPAPLAITANNTNKIYNTALALGTTAFTSSGLVNGETVGGVTLASAGAAANAAVGTYPITASNAAGGTFNPANYSITYNNGMLTVSSGVYGANWTNPASITYGTPLGTNQNNATASVAGSFVYHPPNGTVLPAGTNMLTVSFTPTDTNYASTNLIAPLAVTPAPLTVTANNQVKIYGTTLVLGAGQTAFTSSGLKNGETIGTVTLVASGGTNAAAAVGNYTITPSAATGGTFNPTNYNIIYSNGTLTVSVAADIAVLLSGPPVAVQGSNFVYTITVTNLGPSTASNVVASDTLPSGLTFVSASGGGKNTNGIVTWPKINSFAFGAVTNFTLTVNAAIGTYTNVATAVATTYDPNPTNNNGTSPSSSVATQVGVAPFSILGGTAILNPQTGLFEETVAVTNNTDVLIYGFRLYVANLTSGVTLYNATGTTNGVPYVNYNYPVDAKSYATMVLQFYSPLRVTPTNTLYAEALQLNQIVPPGNVSTNGSALITTTFMDNRIAGDPRFVIEFKSVPGKTYVVIYKDNSSTNWNAATPSLKASANVTQWYDDGPPETQSKPMSVTNRWYRVIQY
jgi:uncharacterized repeat protein (TIGR01451 family)